MANNAPAPDLYDAAGQEWNVDPALLRAIHSGESGFNDNATSPAGAQGRGQFMPATAAGIGMTNTRDPAQAIYGTAKLMRQNLDATKGDVPLALQLYQGGPDRSKWGPQNAAYPAYIAAHYNRGAPPPAAPGAAPAQAGTPLTPPPQTADDGSDPFSAALSSPATPAPAADPFGDALQAAKIETDKANQAAYDASTEGRYVKSYSDAYRNLGKTATTLSDVDAALAPDRIRAALAPAPNTTYGTLIPFAKDDATGDLRPALPSSLRSLAQGAYDLVQGPTTGTVTPEATNALLTAAMGGQLAPSVARGAGAAIGNRLIGQGAGEVPPGPLPGLQLAARANQGGLDASLGGKPNPLPISPMPEMDAMGNPTGTPVAPPESPPAVNANQLPLTPPAQAVPDSLPRAPFFGIPGQSAAEARAQAIIDHFSKGGPTSPTPSPVENVNPTYSQATGNGGLAALENGLRSSDPQFNNMVLQRAAANGDQRAAAFLKVAGAKEDIPAAEAAREQATAAARNAAFANTSPVDPQPVVDQIRTILASPDGKRDAVVRSLNPILDKLQTADGGLETDPAQLYGVRKAINDALSSRGTQESSDAQAATRQLIDVRDALDKAIEPGAPGFGAYIKQYSDMSRPIDGMRYLQGLNLTDSRGGLNLQKVDSAIKTIQRQQGMNGARQADSITPDQLSGLQSLRNDMVREANANATKPVGSNTTQLLATNQLMSAVSGGLDGATLASTVAGLVAGGGIPLGALPIVGARLGLKAYTARGENMVRQALYNKLLNPPTGATPPPP